MTGRKGRTGAPAVVIFQHAAEEPAGILEPLLVGLGADVSSVRLFETNELPPVAATHVIFLGGPMSVNDEREFQCLSQEKALIRAAVKARRPVLGICLGAQLIASACGARVYPCTQEIGWRMVRGVDLAAGNIFAGFPDRFAAFQLHGETFDLPSGAVLLCEGDAVRHQAFGIGPATGLQFHLEITRELIETWTRDLPAEERQVILNDSAAYLRGSSRLCEVLVRRFLMG
jgi:GMP synthase-like glutamine amidotransferase